MSAARRLVVTVCPRERGVVVLPVERGGRAARLDATGVLGALRALVARRGLDDRVHVRDGCAGGCWGAGPNVDVRIYAATNPGERPDHVAMGWKTYVYSLPTLASLADVIDENLPRARATRRRRRCAPRRHRRACCPSPPWPSPPARRARAAPSPRARRHTHRPR